MMHGSSEQLLEVRPEGDCASDDVRRKTSASIEVLSRIWRRVLNHPSLTAADDFFDLGGNPSLAYKLFDQIAQMCGRELPSTVIYSAPTIAALADVLDGPAPPPFPPLILLKPGTEQPPIFIAHGLGSGVMEFFELVKLMRTTRAIYGLQAKGGDGADPPLTRIEDMAQFRLDAIRNVQPHGPYALMGYSLGGVVAFEMARRLAASGERIALLTMIDSYLHTEPLAPRKRIHLAAAQMRYDVSDLMRSLAHRTVRVPLNRVRQRARFSDFLAWTRYRPSFYEGKINFIRAASSHYPDPAAIWERFAAEFEVETVPGDHHTVLSIHCPDLALVLTRHLRSAF